MHLDPSLNAGNSSIAVDCPHPPGFTEMLPVDCCDRWPVYFRLQQLGIPCKCSGYQPLLVQIQTVQSLVQVWSVIRQVSCPRSELATWLNQCWHSSN